MESEIEAVVAWLEEHLRAGDFTAVDSYLKMVSLSDLESPSILGILTITFYGKDKLKNRAFFLEQAEVILKTRLGEVRAENLLKRRR